MRMIGNARMKGIGGGRMCVMRAMTIMITTLTAGVLAGCGAGGGEPRDDTAGMARVMCEDFVGERLKSPSSADFSDVVVEDLPAMTWRVSGVVDADNSFGASLRSDFECVLKGPDGDKWVAESVTID